ncbi:MAG: PAS domain S-box protein [Desulfobacteraceae bacterium]|nr:MAG: PAS domain S-box protein [Desulfobacteraceae bacterium]
MKLKTLFNNFLTSGIKAATPEKTRRIKVLNSFELVFVIVAPLLGLFYFYVEAPLLFQTSMVAGGLGIAAIILLRMTKSPGVVGNFAVLILWGFLFIIRWNTGGMSASGLILLSWVWNAVLILLAIYVTGYMWGTIWACLVFMESGLAVYLFRGGHQFINLIPPDVSPLYSLGFYLIGLLAILLFAFLFEKERDDAQMREEEKSKVLRDSRKYTEDILARSPIPTFILNNSHCVVQWNRACQELTGIKPQQILGKKVWEGFFLDEKGSLADKLLENPEVLPKEYGSSVVSRTESGSFAVETLLPNLKGGLQAIINTAPILDEDGGVKGAIQTIQDISKRQETVRSSSGLTHDSEDHTGFPVFRIDTTGNISSWNNACEEHFGYPSSKMLGNSPLPLISKGYRRDFKASIVRVFKGESFTGKEWKYHTNEGKPCYVLAKLDPTYGLSGQVVECVVVSSDVTDLKLRMRKLERFAVESKERFNKLSEEYDLLKSNIASFIRKKDG